MGPSECEEFLLQSAVTLKKYTSGYGLWAYRNYRQSDIFNAAFLKGLDGWTLKLAEKASYCRQMAEHCWMPVAGLLSFHKV
jgi:hypothetical protein